MKLENKAILDSLEHFYTNLVYGDKTIRGPNRPQGLTMQNQADLLKAMQEEFAPGYAYDSWCGDCVAKFIKDVYRRYEIWKNEHIEPVNDMPKIKIKATFPKNKMQ